MFDFHRGGRLELLHFDVDAEELEYPATIGQLEPRHPGSLHRRFGIRTLWIRKLATSCGC